MKVLFFCKRYYTNKDLINDRFGRLFHLPVQLTRLGADVSAIALDYRDSTGVSEQLYGVTFEAIPATLTHLPRLFHVLQEKVRESAPDVVVASGDSHIGFVGARLAAMAGAKFVFDVYDYYPSFSGNRIPGMRSMFKSALRQADLTLCASQPLMKRLTSRCRRAILIENGVDRDVFVPQDKGDARRRLGLRADAVLVGYFGSITPTRGPLLLEAVKRLRGDVLDLSILLSGKISGVDLEVPGIIYKGELPQFRIPTMISACDVVTVPYAKDTFNDMAGPCKIAEYLACERPVVATRVGGHEAIFRDAPSSLCEPNPTDLARALKGQLDDPHVAPFPEQLGWPNIAVRLHREFEVSLKNNTK